LAHEELYEYTLKQTEKSDFDVFLVDVLWLREFAAKGLLADLTPHTREDFMDVIDIQPEFFDDFACYNSSVYAIPYQYSNQLLYYRKDLFDNMKNRRMFYEQYKVELKCPRTWAEYNAVARFFTREFNPESETLYGTTLGGRYSSAALCEFLPRLWAYGADVFDRHGRVAIDSPDAVKALNNYCESFRYASPGSSNHWWHEQVSEFASGDVAMMILYSSYVSPLVDASVSKVVGKVAFASIPGAKPVLGGWSFAINRRSKSQSAALQFIKWACSRDLAIPSTLLGNLSACRSIYNNAEVKSIYPWIAKSLEIYPDSMRRALPKEKAAVGIKRYEEIIAEAVHESILGNIAPAGAIKKAAEGLTALLNGGN
jgi:ABC-type glycerol-3-phosphate transport system substrate-binding protein